MASTLLGVHVPVKGAPRPLATLRGQGSRFVLSCLVEAPVLRQGGFGTAGLGCAFICTWEAPHPSGLGLTAWREEPGLPPRLSGWNTGHGLGAHSENQILSGLGPSCLMFALGFIEMFGLGDCVWGPDTTLNFTGFLRSHRNGGLCTHGHGSWQGKGRWVGVRGTGWSQVESHLWQV